jgi:hypothetical protein
MPPPNPTIDPLEPLRLVLKTFEDGFSDAFAKADPTQKAELKQQLAALRHAYWTARAEALDASSAAFTAIAADLRTVNQSLVQQLQNLQDIAALIQVCTQAVQLATALAGLVAPVPGVRAFAGVATGRARGRRAARAPGGASAGAGAMRILCLHGVGDHHSDVTWQTDWANAIRNAIWQFDPGREVTFHYMMYDYIFQKYPLDAGTIAGALWKLSVSGIVNGIGDLFRRSRGIADVSSRVRWTAGMVVQWAQEADLRTETRALLGKTIREVDPHLICAHSLGSLVMYDTLVRDDGPHLAGGRRLMTFGSQIGNPFVRNTFGGRIVPLAADFWYHLFNRNDDVFAHEIRLSPERFVQIDTEFDLPGIGDHDAIAYLGHERALDRAWREIAARAAGARLFGPIQRTFTARAQRASKPQQRALLVGINEYPNPENRLEGCVNDVFTISAVLQETGFLPEDIRVVLDDRATADGIRERLRWLLQDVSDDPADERFFYYSGHGAQMPTYGEGDKTDHVDECLVPWDFDWNEQTAITDDDFFELYSQLPYRARFVAIFDCCHSGGMTRAGGSKVRGLSPPDDIRHRAMKWDPVHQMWSARKLPAANADLEQDKDQQVAYVGESGAAHRLGRAIPLRRLRDAQYDEERAAAGHKGPYLPIILQACEEAQLSYEYRHGVTSHGAFTYSLARVLREHRVGGKAISFLKLRNQLARELEDLGYDQTPCLVGPSKVIRQPIPWRVAAGKRRPRKRR